MHEREGEKNRGPVEDLSPVVDPLPSMSVPQLGKKICPQNGVSRKG